MARGYPDYEGQKSGLYSVAEWAAKEGTDKNLWAYRENAVFDEAPVDAWYLVPAGKTLYICGLSFRISATLVADAYLNQMGYAYIEDLTTLEVKALVGGNGGGGLVFSKPFVIPANHTLVYPVVCKANHACDIDVTAWGFLI